MKRYDPKIIEAKWQKNWEESKTFKVDIEREKKPILDQRSQNFGVKPKFYNLMMFPYPSGEGLHVGHVYAFGGADTYGRFKRMQGFDVFEPMGFDSFGIHSENYAIKVKKHPKELISETTKYFREEQLKKLGALFDWDHQVTTSDPSYYKWTQWLFIQLFKAGLAVRKKAAVDWCPSCKTVLADEQVISGKCERCGSEVKQRELEQWFLKTTDYAERLLKNLERIDWSQTTKTMQRNWIGRSEGLEINFRVQGRALQIKVFTTRPDTIFGATFMVLSPEHELAPKLATDKFSEAARKYIADSATKSAEERQKAKTGVFTGAYCINPFTKKEISIWIADYVLMGYGTGAVMGVPAHDERDYEFAAKNNLEITEVINGGDVEKQAYLGEGKLVNSGQFNGLNSKEAIQKISEYIETSQLGHRTVNYHLRDWLISRQRYWGPPIPMIFCDSCAEKGDSWFTTDEAKKKFGNNKFQNPNAKSIAKSEILKASHLSSSPERRARSDLFDISHYTRTMAGWYTVKEDELPVELPQLKNYQPRGTGVSPLATLPDFVSVKCPNCGKNARRETDVSDTFLDSAWYFLRYPTVGSANENKVAFDERLTKKWLPVDSYIGGNEHAVLHLLYTRFITMALKDIGKLDFEEPFKKFRAHGLVIHQGAKMSKSRGNVVNPNEFIESYGADTLRMYLLFIGSYDQGGEFSDRAIAGVYRFLNRVWSLINESVESGSNSGNDRSLRRELNKLIKTVGEDLENLKFNTAIASLMEFLNLMTAKKAGVNKSVLKQYVLLLSPFAPHITEELWNILAEKFSVHNQKWPSFSSKFLEEDKVTLVIQVNGRLRDQLEAHKGISKEEVGRLALDRPKIKFYTRNKKILKSIWIDGRLLNLVVGD